MSFFEGVVGSVWKFVQLVWLDLLILAASVTFCVVSSFLFPKAANKRGQKQNPVTKVMNDLKMPFRRHQKQPSALAGVDVAELALDANGFPVVESREAYVAAIRNCQGNGGVDATFGLLKEMQRLGFDLPTSMVTRMFKEQSPAG